MSVLNVGVISIVDDDESVRAATKALLRSAGHDVRTFASAELFLESADLRETECLILDIRMPNMDGLELQQRLKTVRSSIRVIFVSGESDRANQEAAMEAGAVDFFHKPFDAHLLLVAVQAALRNRGAV